MSKGKRDRSTLFFEAVVENLPNMVFIKEARELRFVHFNRAGEKLLGLTNDQLLGKNDYDFFPKVQADFFVSKDRKVLTEGKLLEIPEEPIETPNGRRILFTRKVPINDANGDPEYLLGISWDITELKEAQTKLDLSLKEAGMGLWEWEVSTDRMYWDQTLGSLYGTLPAHSVSTLQDWKRYIAGDDIAAVEREFQSAIRDGKPFRVQYRVARDDGMTRHVRSAAHLERDKDGRVSRFLGVTWDITDQVEKAQELDHRRQMDAHQAKMVAIGEMSSGIAHEINNPLAVISGKARSLARGVEQGTLKPEDLLLGLKKIEDTVFRIAKIIRSLRSFSRDSQSGDREYFSMASVIEDTLDLCRERFKNYGVTLEVPDQFPEVLHAGDRIQISQLLLNLLSNAFDAVQGSRERVIRIRVSELEDALKLSITDSGEGISQEARSKIFLPFFTTKPPGQGTGLGLSISVSIAREHGGRLYLDESSSETCFVVELPRARCTSDKQAA